MGITQRDIACVRALHTKKGRNQQGTCIIEGIRAISAWLLSGRPVHKIYLTPERSDEYLPLLPECVHTYLAYVPERIMNRLSSQTTPAGILAIAPIPEKYPLTQGPVLVLAGLQDPGNVGTLIRTALALGVDTIVCVNTVDLWSPKVIQASAGTLASARIIYAGWDELVSVVSAHRLAALTLTGGIAPHEIPTRIAQELSIVVGNEGSGLPAHWQAACGYRITLPMPGHARVESLNAAIAGALALYALHVR